MVHRHCGCARSTPRPHRRFPGPEDASYPFWSPQSDAIGFFAAGKLKTVPIAGGVPRTLATVANGRGAAWSEDSTILFSAQTKPLYRISDRGGPETIATTMEAGGVTSHRWPTFVGPRHFVYTVQGGRNETGLFLASLDYRHDETEWFIIEHAVDRALFGVLGLRS